MRFLVFQHHPAEHPGCFRSFLDSDGIAWDAIRLDAGDRIPDMTGYDALLAFGGPMDVWEDEEHPWLDAERAAIRHFVRDLNRPYLGICLGHQLLASALGGTVGKMHEPEVGVTDVHLTVTSRTDPVFHNLPVAIPVLQWHGAEVTSLPPCGVVLAANQTCGVQAMRVGEFAYGVQFHVELEDTTVRQWGEIAEYRCALEAVKGADAQQALEKSAAAAMSAFRENALALHENFCRLVRAARNARRNR